MKPNQPSSYFATPAAVEAAFYSAFEMGDIQLMNAVLAEHNGVVCVHPGATPVLGREAVLESWTGILANSIEPVVYPNVISASIFDDVAVHLVNERIAQSHHPDSSASVIITTNIYIRQANGWRMLEHHASLPQSQVRKVVEKHSHFQTTHEGPSTLQ
jgi:hypothetical protein